MKALLLVCVLVLFSCEDKIHTYCWKCQSYIRGKVIEDMYCGDNILAVEGYKERLMEFYQGAMTNIECQLDSIH